MILLAADLPIVLKDEVQFTNLQLWKNLLLRT